MHEASLHTQNCFLTLTFAPQNLPSSLSVDVRDWQLFAKRLRKRKGSFRYLACGEYGELNLRPHYHAVVFGLDFSEDREVFSVAKGNVIYRSPELDEVWGLGHATIGAVTYQSAAYVARYCLKKVSGTRAESHYERVDPETGEVHQVKPEFAVMSRGGKGGAGGIGKRWFEKFSSDVLPCDEVVFQGKKYPVPRYYSSLFEREFPSEFEAVKAARRAKALASPNKDPRRREAGEFIQESKVKTFRRDV